MKSPLRVVWSEGLLMSPQHLQQADRFHEQLLSARIEAIEPLSWGVLRVSLDRRALESGQVKLTEFVGVLPDGEAVAAGGASSELPPSRPLDGHFPASATSLDVHLAVPREREGFANLSPDAAGRSRYVLAEQEVDDLAAGAGRAKVAFGRRNLSLRLGDEPREDFESVKVAEVVRDDGGRYVLSEPYIPPVLRIGASSFLMAGLRRVAAGMVTRQRALSESRRQRGDSTVEFQSSDVTRFLLLNAINGALPVVQHMVDAADLHPRACYLTLSQLAGQLATFSQTEDPTTLPKFVYTDLRSTFEELFARITALLQATIQENYTGLKLDARDDGVHFGRLDKPELLTATQYLIAIKTEVDERETASQLPRLSKIASWDDINGILSAAAPGVPTEVTYRPPPEIPVKAGTVYFTLSTANGYWRNIMADRTLAIYLPRPFVASSTTVELLAVGQGS